VIPHRWVSALLVAAFAAVGAPSALAQGLPSGVDDCLAKIKAPRAPDAEAPPRRRGDPTAAPTLGEVCPDVAAALGDNPWGEALAGVSPDDLETSAFVDLATLVARYERPPADVERPPPPGAAALDDVLAELKLEKPAALTIWQRIQQWYDEHFGANGDEARGWLEKWLQRFAPSERLVSYFVIVLGIVLVAVTIAIVHNELRVAGVFRGGVLRKYTPLGQSSGSEPQPRGDFDDVARAPLARRPVLLLALVLQRLRARGVLPSRDSLTHRELLHAARLSAPQSAAFGAVLDAAERVTFADWRPAEEDVGPVLARGRELLSSLPTEVGPK
jgi:hypothetical protein